jgi:hypothetical protein
MAAFLKVGQKFEAHGPAVDDFNGIGTIIAVLQFLHGFNSDTLIGKQDVT